MKSLVLLCLLLVELVSVISSHPMKGVSAGSCAFGTEYNDGCNHCICHGSSGSTCTRLPNCPVGTRAIPDSPVMDKVHKAIQRGHCSLGLEFEKDCNICTCQGELGYICTKKECSTNYKNGANNKNVVEIPESPMMVSSTTMAPGRCILGHRFFNGCNLCVCYGEYFGYRCARMENCREQRLPMMTTTMMPMPTVYQKQTGMCPKGETYNDGYYACKCRTDLKGYVCTVAIS